MNRVTITLTIDLPDGVVPEVGYGTAPDVDYRDTAPQFEPPLPDAPPPDMLAEARQIFEVKSAEARGSGAPVCPDGHGVMKFVPGGVSKRTGKQYDAFYGCNDRDCKRTAQAA